MNAIPSLKKGEKVKIYTKSWYWLIKDVLFKTKMAKMQGSF
jgi:hypothetical protein